MNDNGCGQLSGNVALGNRSRFASVDELSDFLERGIRVAYIANADATSGDVAETKRIKGI